MAQHISSNELFARYDIGINSDWKHDKYKEHCPEGYELIWLDDPKESEELDAAYAKNQEIGRLAELEANK